MLRLAVFAVFQHACFRQRYRSRRRTLSNLGHKAEAAPGGNRALGIEVGQTVGMSAPRTVPIFDSFRPSGSLRLSVGSELRIGAGG
jgi:hypothetical protein